MEERSSKLSLPLPRGDPLLKKVHLNWTRVPHPLFQKTEKNHLPLTFLAAFWHAKAAFFDFTFLDRHQFHILGKMRAI